MSSALFRFHQQIISGRGTLLLCDIALSDIFKSASYVFHFGHPGRSQQANFELNKLSDILRHPEFDAGKNTTLFCHGYDEKQEDESIKVIVDAYLYRGNNNLIVMNWTNLARGNYLFRAVPNMYELSPVIAADLLELFNQGFDVENMHLVGHSLGGQLVGAIGRNVKTKSENQTILRRITALDPAFPGFYPGFIFQHISANDARFVDIIHTDSGIYGAPVRTGSVDFCPNGGFTLQPGCPKRDYRLLTDNDLCSHRRSWRYWAESVAKKYPQKFNAIQAKSWVRFKRGVTLHYDAEVVMGIDCPENIRGKYYLITNAEEPFAKGPKGAQRLFF